MQPICVLFPSLPYGDRVRLNVGSLPKVRGSRGGRDQPSPARGLPKARSFPSAAPPSREASFLSAPIPQMGQSEARGSPRGPCAPPGAAPADPPATRPPRHPRAPQRGRRRRAGWSAGEGPPFALPVITAGDLWPPSGLSHTCRVKASRGSSRSARRRSCSPRPLK